MSVEAVTVMDDDTIVSGRTRMGRRVEVRLSGKGTVPAIDVSVEPLEGTDYNEATAETELRRVMQETEIIRSRLSARFGPGPEDFQAFIRTTASVLEGREVEDHEIEALVVGAGDHAMPRNVMWP